MSGWRLAVREIAEAGGSKPANRLYSPRTSVEQARQKGLIERPGIRGLLSRVTPTTLTPLGQDYAAGRVEPYTPYKGHGPTGGRAKGTILHWRATWLASLPRANEVRLTGDVHRAQDDGTCYW